MQPQHGCRPGNQRTQLFALLHDDTPHHITQQIREAYISLKHWPREDRLRLLLTQAAGRMATIQRKRDEKLAIRRRVQLKQRSQLFAKIKRERLKRLRKLRFGQGWGATRRQAADAARGREVKATWAQRKLRPPGKMQRRF
jgi:hypothetical protein